MKKITLILLSLIIIVLSACQHQKQENIPQESIPAHRINDKEVHADAQIHNVFLWIVVENKSLSRDDAWKIINYYNNQYKDFGLINIELHCDSVFANKDALNSQISDEGYYSHVLYWYMNNKRISGELHFEGVGDKDYYGTACNAEETERQSTEKSPLASNEDAYRNILMKLVQQTSQAMAGATSTAQKVTKGQITSSQAIGIFEVYLQNTIDVKNKIKNLNPPPHWQEIHTKTLRAHDLLIESYRLGIEGLRDNQQNKMDLAGSKAKESAQELQAADELMKALGYLS